MAMISSVWNDNFEEEMIRINSVLYRYRTITFDTEFPGFIRNTPRNASEETRYDDMKFNVDQLKLIQLGITLCDGNGEIGGVWEFNFQDFDPDTDAHGDGSVDFLTKSGLDFDRMKKEGVDPIMFGHKFMEVVSLRKGLQWVTFHGLYDIGYLIKLVTNRAMPESISAFVGLSGKILGRVYDVKLMARFCPGLLDGELGLEKLAKILNVARLGGAHQAGSDSLLTALVFSKMKRDFRLAEGTFEGFLYGIGNKIVNQKRPVIVVFPMPQRFYRRPLLQCPTYVSMPPNLRPMVGYPVNHHYIHM